MSLYRKYRPAGWKEVIGEDHIVTVLENEIKLGTVAHAYLFSGSRGTGKTSVARIFARELGTSDADTYEIDAASNTGVDDIRALNESVHTLPFDSKYKIYILDEAHMLSKSAWNALLKTLEEPPAHVIFILATTELEKVPETVVSRCQTFVFRAPTQAILRDFAKAIGKKEGVKVDASAADLIALLGDGSFRDTHSILEKILSSTKEETITREMVEAVTGAPKSQLIRDVLESVVTGNLQLGLASISAAKALNADMKIFAKLILERLRFLFLIRLKAGLDKEILNDVSEDDYNFLKELAGKAGKSLTADVLLTFIDAYDKSGKTSIPELPLELALIETVRGE